MTSTETPRRSSIASVIGATVAGTTMEWYDFYLYATASALVFGKLFFPSFSPMVGTLAAFGTFAAGFLIRPIGGIVFGHLGDRVGRKKVLTLTLILMGVASTLIGLVPSYAAIGFFAPVLLTLLRLIQGFGAGAEYAGAVIMTAENSPAKRRGMYTALPYTGVSLGLLLSTAIIAGVSNLPDDQLLSWGWRVPFLVSAVIAIVGIYLRFRVLETPVFEEAKRNNEISKVPFVELWRNSRRELLCCWGARLGDNSLAYIFESFVVVYVTTTLGLPKQLILTGILIAGVVSLVTVPAFGALTDKVGRRAVYAGGAIASAAFAFPFFFAMDTKNRLVIWLALIVASGLFKAAMTGAQAVFFVELFPARYRYSGFAIGREVTSPIAGGLTPLAATALFAAIGAVWPVALYLIVMCVVTALSVLAAPETRRAAFTGREPVGVEASPVTRGDG